MLNTPRKLRFLQLNHQVMPMGMLSRDGEWLCRNDGSFVACLPAQAGLRVKSQLFTRPSRTSWGAATSLTAPSRAVLGRDVQDATMETSPVVNDDTDDHVHDERTFGTVTVDSFLLR
jgi:hypothetical protein